MKYVFALLVAIAAAYGVGYYYNEKIEAIRQEVFGADTVKPIAGTTYTLAGSGLSSSATSITLSSLTIPQTGQELQDSDFSDTFYLTIEPGNRTRQEIVACTTVTQGSGSTATLSGCSRGMSPITPYTASTSLQFAHAGGAQVIFSDPPQLFNQFAGKDNDEQITGTWGFGALPTSSVVCTENAQFCNKLYIDQGFNQGAATSSFSNMGLVQLATFIDLASSTASSSLQKPLVASTKYSTTTPGILCTNQIWNCWPVANLAGKISQTWLNLTESFTWTGNHLWTAAASSTNMAALDVFYVGRTATSTLQGSTTGTSTLQGFLSVLGTNSTSTFIGNASTTNFNVDRACYGCPMTYTGSSTVYSLSAAQTFTGSAPALANTALADWSVVEGGAGTRFGEVIITRSGKTTQVVENDRQEANPCAYNFAWSGANLTIDETADSDGDCSISGTVYWYK